MAEQKRKVSEEKIKSLFDRFDGTHCSKAITYLSLRKFSHYPRWDDTLVYKVGCIKNFVSLIQKEINLKYSNTLGSKFSIDRNMVFYADPNMPTVYTKLRISQNGKNDIIPLSLNIPLDKLITMPAMEIYSILSAASHDVIQKSLIGKQGVVSDIDLSDEQEKNIEVNSSIKESVKLERNKERAQELLSKYLEGFLSQACGEEFYEFDDISSLVAAQIIDGLEGEDLEKMLGLFFDFSQFNDTALSHVASFTEKEVFQLRASKLYQKASDLWKDPDKVPEALNATQQYQALMSVSLKEQFSKVAHKGLKNGAEYDVDVEEFCISYADAFMDSNGLKPIPITFKNEGELGTYIDEGNAHSININLSKINSVTELVSTLSHELTHAVESAINKANGGQTPEGFGLADNISYDISGISDSLKNGSENEKYLDLLKRLNKYCYHINPNERSARFGELSAIKFMSAIADTDVAKKELRETAESFNRYQTKTYDILTNLSDKQFVSNLKAEVDEVLSSSISTHDKKYFSDRFDYIKEITSSPKNLNAAMEIQSIKEVFEKNKVISKEVELTDVGHQPGS